jgi:hypothetical protein
MTEQAFGIDITPEDSVVPIYLVELTEEEVAEREQLAAQEAQRIKDQERAELERKEAIQSALDKLAKLGLTEEEAKAIAGV